MTSISVVYLPLSSPLEDTCYCHLSLLSDGASRCSQTTADSDGYSGLLLLADAGYRCFILYTTTSMLPFATTLLLHENVICCWLLSHCHCLLVLFTTICYCSLSSLVSGRCYSLLLDATAACCCLMLPLISAHLGWLFFIARPITMLSVLTTCCFLL